MSNSNQNEVEVDENEPQHQTCWKCRQSFTTEQMHIHASHCQQPTHSSRGVVREARRSTVR